MEKSKKIGFIALGFALFCFITVALAFTNILPPHFQENFAIWCPMPGLLSLLYAIYMLWNSKGALAKTKVKYDGYVLLQNTSNGKYLAFDGNKRIYVSDRSKAVLLGQAEAERIAADSDVPLVLTLDQRDSQSPGSSK